MRPLNIRKQTALLTLRQLFVGLWRRRFLLPRMYHTSFWDHGSTGGCRYIGYLHTVGAGHENVSKTVSVWNHQWHFPMLSSGCTVQPPVTFPPRGENSMCSMGGWCGNEGGNDREGEKYWKDRLLFSQLSRKGEKEYFLAITLSFQRTWRTKRPWWKLLWLLEDSWWEQARSAENREGGGLLAYCLLSVTCWQKRIAMVPFQ